MDTTTALPNINAGSRVRIAKGCKAREIRKGVTAFVQAVEPLGAAFGHEVRVTLKLLNGFGAGRVVNFYARHTNRLSDPTVRLNDGNPLHVIEVSRA
jgi:hypothetical protein